jgi:hypothetical protein
VIARTGQAASNQPATRAGFAALVSAWAFRLALQGAAAVLRLVVRPRRRVVMLSREQSSEPLDFTLLREAIRRVDPTCDIRVNAQLQNSGLWGRVRFAARAFAQAKLVATARVVVVDTHSPAVSFPRWSPRRVRVIQVWHALGALKMFGWDSVGRPGGRPRPLARAMRMHHGYDLVLASSDRCRVPYASAFGLPSSRIVVSPLPRVDKLVNLAGQDADRKRILTSYPQLGGARVVLYAPTFHHGTDDAGPVVDPAALAAALAARGFTLVVAPHPLDVLPPAAYPLSAPGRSQSARPLGEASAGSPAPSAPVRQGPLEVYEFTAAELTSVAEAFVTDYSSMVFEAALVGLPCYFYAPDLANYRRERGLYLDYTTDLPGPVLATPEDLAEALAGGRATAEAALAFADAWVTRPPPGPCGRAPGCADAMAGIVLGVLERSVEANAARRALRRARFGGRPAPRPNAVEVRR